MNIIGRLTKDAEVRTIRDQQQVVNFSVAINESYRRKNGEQVKKTTYFDCSYWRTVNVACALTKGTLVELTGSPSAKAWIGKDGEARASLNFKTDQIKFHGGGAKHTTAATQAAIEKPQPMEDDLPF
ncbi:single-strand DNA-binding protein [Chitinophaga eiseniae]|uniref:Single-stranded DNA-binding protein n=1 Tax=Chitinophaga eiseniae TaxID=634771 RepID=A0A1T4SZ29_9BACT|nr:single-stranded DNA-binding protein [Chitinophaga eiseniae]SKA33201.1 single-strand DNA-binding protein [Chitinophaga eiseniae]